MARQERATRTRQEILRAAGEVFAALGYDATTIADIVKQSGVTRGALYFHFESKNDVAQGLLNAQVESVPRPPVTELRLQSVVDRGMLLAYLMPRDPLVRGSVRLALDRRNWPGADHKKPYLDWIREVERDLNAAKEHGELLPYAALEQTAELLVGAFAGLQLMSHVLSGLSDLEERASVLYSTVLPAITTPTVLGRLDISPGRGERVMASVVATRAAAGDLRCENELAESPGKRTAGAGS